MVVIVIDSRVYLMGLNLGVDPSINRNGKLISLVDSDQVDISLVYHCDGLLLCITKDYSRFVVWNPYSGQTRWLEPASLHPRMDWCTYAIGYDESGSYKILRFVDIRRKQYIEYEIYDLKSDSWKFLDDTSDWFISYYARGVSVKGNTYWFAQDSGGVFDVDDFLICFDFTTERFGPRLPLPFHSNVEDTVTLSSVREQQLAVLFQRWDTMEMEVWVTTKIEPRAVLWNKVFLAVDMEPLTDFHFGLMEGSFFIDEEKKIVVVFVQDKDNEKETPHNAAYIIGEDGYFRTVDLGESTKKDSCPLACSYAPSSVHIKH